MPLAPRTPIAARRRATLILAGALTAPFLGAYPAAAQAAGGIAAGIPVRVDRFVAAETRFEGLFAADAVPVDTPRWDMGSRWILGTVGSWVGFFAGGFAGLAFTEPCDFEGSGCNSFQLLAGAAVGSSLGSTLGVHVASWGSGTEINTGATLVGAAAAWASTFRARNRPAERGRPATPP